MPQTADIYKDFTFFLQIILPKIKMRGICPFYLLSVGFLIG